MVIDQNTTQSRPKVAFLYAVPIGLLGGLIGLGGAEFRLPVLAGPLGYATRQAIPLNLAVSLITVLTALLTRSRVLELSALNHFAPAIIALISGAVVAAYLGTIFVGHVSEEKLERTILVLLVAIGTALTIEGFLPNEVPALLPTGYGWHIAAGLSFGLMIGLVSSLLGVAGGELIIPTLVFIYGMDIKIAGTASLIISLPTVLVGVVRYAQARAFAKHRDWLETIAPMGIGSVIGAILGGLLVGLMPASWLKIILGAILNISALRIFTK